jgi:hypothetical protein
MKEQKCYSLEGRLFKTGGPTRSQARQRNSEASSRAAWGSEAGFGRAFDQAAIGMALVGLDGAWLRVNEALCQIALVTLSTSFWPLIFNRLRMRKISRHLDNVGQMLRREIRAY